MSDGQYPGFPTFVGHWDHDEMTAYRGGGLGDVPGCPVGCGAQVPSTLAGDLEPSTGPKKPLHIHGGPLDGVVISAECPIVSRFAECPECDAFGVVNICDGEVWFTTAVFREGQRPT